MNTRNPYRLFLVDDHHVLLDGLCSALGGYQHIHIAGTASSYDNALEQISDSAFCADIVVTDYFLGSRYDGIDLCRAVKSNRPSQLVALLTSHDSEALRFRAQRAAVDCFITKSTSVNEIVDLLDALMDNKFALDSHPSTNDAAGLPLSFSTELSFRELEVLRLITCEELTTKQIAERLHRSIQTIEAHRARMFQKLGVDSVVGLVKYAMSINLCDEQREGDHSGNA